MIAVYKKEIRSYLHGMIGWVMMALILAFIGFFTVIMNIWSGTPNMEYTLIVTVSFWGLILIVPFVTMRSVAEERHSKTEQLLLSLPIPTHKIVLAKYLAMLTVVGIPLLIVGVYPILFSLVSEVEGVVNLATAYNGWFLFVLMTAAMVAIGMFASSLVENQIIAAVISAGVFFLMYFMNLISGVFPSGAMVSLIAFVVLAALLGAVVLALTKNSTAACVVTGVIAVVLIALYVYDSGMFYGAFPAALSSLAFFDVFMYGGANLGVFDVAGVVYYISFSAVFVFLTVESIERRRYN